MPPHDSWYNVLVRPAAENYPLILGSTLACFTIQLLSRWLGRALMPKAWGHMEKQNVSDEWCVRHVSTAHCLVAWTLIPGLFLLPDHLTTDMYGFDPWTQKVLSVSVGYFIWDLLVCLWYRWPLSFFCHCIGCFAVMYAGLYPFLHQEGRFFLGVFELSTPWLNMYKQLQLTGNVQGPAYLVLGLLFAVSFTVCRIFIGIPYSIMWWGRIYDLWKSGQAHSTAVLAMALTSNVLLTGVNLLWWKGILDMVVRRLRGRADSPKVA